MSELSKNNSDYQFNSKNIKLEDINSYFINNISIINNAGDVFKQSGYNLEELTKQMAKKMSKIQDEKFKNLFIPNVPKQENNSLTTKNFNLSPFLYLEKTKSTDKKEKYEETKPKYLRNIQIPLEE